METRRLTILLTRYPTRLARFLCLCSGCYYLHASIGFGDDISAFYSFGLKGFRTERAAHTLKPDREPFACALFELEVSEDVYRRAKEVVYSFELRKSLLRYTRLGVAMAMLRLGCRWQNHYFCTQFVAYVLEKAHAVRLKKDSSLYLAKDLCLLDGVREVYRGDMLGLARRYAAQAA